MKPRPFETLRQVVAEAHGLTVAELSGTGIKRAVAWPRQDLAYLVRTLLRLSYAQIARLMRQDRTTVMHAHQRVEKRLWAHRSIRIRMAWITAEYARRMTLGGHEGRSGAHP